MGFDFIDEDKITEPTNVWGINNVVQIALLSFKEKVVVISPITFNQYVAKKSYHNGSNIIPKATYGIGNYGYMDPVSAYPISQDNLSGLTTKLNRTYTAWHYDNGGDSLINWSGKAWDGDTINKKCTEFYKLFWMDDSDLKNKQFKVFDANGALEKTAKRWLRVDLKNTSFSGYLKIYYRTLEDYYNYNSCGQNNLNLDNYINNYNNCQNYINDYNKKDWIADACIKDSNTNKLFTICDKILSDNAVNTSKKRAIVQKQMEYCSKDSRLIDDKNCQKFLDVGFSDSIGYLQSDKKKYLDPIARDVLCKKGHNNYPFCYCLNNEQKEKIYGPINAKRIDDICIMNYCNENAYRPSNYNEITCPPICIQSIDGVNATLKGITQQCNIDSFGKINTEADATNTIVESSPSSTPTPLPSTPLPSTPTSSNILKTYLGPYLDMSPEDENILYIILYIIFALLILYSLNKIIKFFQKKSNQENEEESNQENEEENEEAE